MSDKVTECQVADLSMHEADQDNTANEANSKSTLLNLPAEIRLIIYEYTFANQTVRVHPKAADPVGNLHLLPLHESRKYQHVASLLRTCRLVRKEAAPIFNAVVTFDLTPYYNCMGAAYELGPDMCKTIKAIRVAPMLARRLTLSLQQGITPNTNYRDLLPSLQHVYVPNSVLFGVFTLSHEVAIRALRLYFGHQDLQVHFFDTGTYFKE